MKPRITGNTVFDGLMADLLKDFPRYEEGCEKDIWVPSARISMNVYADCSADCDISVVSGDLEVAIRSAITSLELKLQKLKDQA